MEKLWKLTHTDGGIDYAFYCPGCKELHSYIVKMGESTAKYRREAGLNFVEWGFNGNEEKPTFTPSLLYNKPGHAVKLCHLFVTDGMIQFCSDSQHDLAGKTVELPVIPY